MRIPSGSARTRIAPLFVASFAAALVLLPSTAEAGGDSIYGTRGGERMSEREHAIEIELERGWATLTVQRTVHNAIDRHDEAQVSIFLPETAVATSLRTLGEQDGKPQWFVADLLEAEHAAAVYTELTGHGGYYPKDPALLSWRNPTQLMLQVFPVAPHTDKTVDYTLTMPASYEAGRWVIRLPSLGQDSKPAIATLEPANPLDQLFVDGEVIGRGHMLTLDRDVVIELAPRDPAAIELELAAVDTGASRELVHYQVTAARRISTLPSRARIVVIVDLSRSRAGGELEAQRRAALAYLAHFVDPALAAEVALLGFNHEVHALSPGFVPAAEAVELLEQAPLALRNGSEIGLALAEADALLSKAGKGPRRIVLVSDFETASALAPEHARQAVEHSRAIVHLAALESGAPELTRDDAHPWAPLAAATHGVMWTAAAPWEEPGEPITAEEQAVFEEWARPLRVDRLRVRVDGAAFEDADFVETPETLAEGEGLAELLLSRLPATGLHVEGLLWNEPITHAQKPSRSAGDRWAALVFGHAVADRLSEDEMMTLAMRGGAVSPVTSYLAIEPGVRPSTEGILAEERGWGVGFGESGGMGLGSIGLMGRGSGGPTIDPQDWLDAELGDAWQRCGGQADAGSVALETMSGEILDAKLQLASEPDRALKTCMMQLVWTVELPNIFAQRERWTVQL